MAVTPRPATEFSVFVTPEAIYPGLESSERTLAELLATLSRNDTLFACARIGAIVSGPGDFDAKARQQRALNELCTNEEIDRINVFAQQYARAGLISVFFRGQLLELIRWAAKHCAILSGDGNTFTDPQVRSRFVRAALVASALWSRRVYGDKLKNTGDVEASRQRALGPFRKSVEESNLGPHLAVTLGRGLSLFSDYFPKRYPNFEREFAAATEMTVEEYLTFVTGLSTYVIHNNPDGPRFHTETVGAATAYRDLVPTYLRLESQSPDQLARSLWDEFPKAGYRSMMERPILVTEKGWAIILDPSFYCEKISIGPLFHLLRGVPRRKANEIFGAFGLAFEDYATDILKRMYPTPHGLARRLSCNVHGRDGDGRDFEIDAVLNDVTELVVIEMKAAWLREDAIKDNDQNWVEHIRSKYGVASRSEGNRRERAKGVAQLARIIGAIANDGWVGEQGEFAEARVTYPVLVVHDKRMDAPAYGDFLAKDFVSLLPRIDARKRIAPLTVMTIDHLETLESSVDAFSLRELLADYTRACPDRVRSLHNFIAFSKYGPKIKNSTQLLTKAIELMDRSQERLFPPS